MIFISGQTVFCDLFFHILSVPYFGLSIVVRFYVAHAGVYSTYVAKYWRGKILMNLVNVTGPAKMDQVGT